MNLLFKLINRCFCLPYNNRVISTIIYFGALSLAQIIKGSIVAEFNFLLPLFFLVQFFGSTIQGGISDIYKRANILNISLCVVILSIFALILVYEKDSHSHYLLESVFILILGLGGNIDVVGRAGLIDLHYHIDRRKLLAWSVFVEAFGWVLVGLMIRIFNYTFFDVLIICLIGATILLPISLIFNSDQTQDKKHLKNVFNEILKISTNNRKLLIPFTMTFIISELGYFFFFYSQENIIPEKNITVLTDSYFAWFASMTAGCYVLSRFKRQSDFVLLLSGLIISLIAVILFWFSGMRNILIPGSFIFDSIVFGIAGFGSGIFLPCFYSILSRKHSIHVQGVLIGWVDSLRVAGDAISNLSLFGVALLPIIFAQGIPIYLSTLMFSIAMLLLIFYKKKSFKE